MFYCPAGRVLRAGGSAFGVCASSAILRSGCSVAEGKSGISLSMVSKRRVAYASDIFRLATSG